MISIRRHTLAAALLACVALGWWWGSGDDRPAPLSQRPVARFFSRVAKLGLWVMWAAEPTPAQPQQLVHAHPPGELHSLNHGAGW